MRDLELTQTLPAYPLGCLRVSFRFLSRKQP